MTRRRPYKSRFSEEIKASQENVLWPNVVRNSRRSDALLWRGSPDATLVQRIGICLFGLAFFGIGLMFFRLAQRENSRPLGCSHAYGSFWVPGSSLTPSEGPAANRNDQLDWEAPNREEGASNYRTDPDL